jgi:hypothetical protein
MRHLGKHTTDVVETLYTDHYMCSPCYVGLKNNVSTRLLETTLDRFPVGTDEFVSHNVLKDYIQSTAIASGVHELTRYNTEVKTVLKQDKSWIVEAATLHIDDVGVTTRILNSSVRVILPYFRIDLRLTLL